MSLPVYRGTVSMSGIDAVLAAGLPTPQGAMLGAGAELDAAAYWLTYTRGGCRYVHRA